MQHFYGWQRNLVRVALAATVLLNTVYAQSEVDQTLDSVQQLNEVQVTSLKMPVKSSYSGMSTQVWAGEDLIPFQTLGLERLLEQMAGLVVQGTQGPKGSPISLYFRGGRSQQLLVVIDGVRISDPNSAGLTFDLRLLDVSQIERIELLKGASSALYGTHAAVGVLSITTKKRDAGTQWGVWTKQSLRQSDQLLDWATQGAQWGMDLQHQMGKWGVMLQTQSLDNRGISALMDTPEADRFQQQQWKISTDYTPNDRTKYRLGVEYSAHESAYDDAYLMQDRDFMYTTDMWRISLQSELINRKGSWHRSMAWTQISSEDQSDYPGVYKGFNWNSDTYYKTSLSQNHFMLLGLQAGYDVVPDIEEAHVYWYDPYVNWVYAQNKWQINSGVRYNQHQTYGGHWVYHINPSYTVETAQGSLQWMGTLGSSFISPSLFQLYGPFGANRSLRPEESTNAELGVHWKAKKGYSFELHAYQRQVENAVYWDNTAFAYGNDPVNQRVKGGELQFKSVDFRGFSSQMSYAFVDAQGLSGLRIPRHRWTAFAQYKSTREQTWSMSGVWTGKREDMDFTEYTLVDLAPFYTVDFSWTYTSQSAPWQLQLSMRNATNQQFVEQWGYNTLGRMFQAGLFYRLKY